MSGLTVALLCSAAVIIANAEKCLTPNGEEAECISLYNCSFLLDALKTLEPKSVEFVQKSQCGYNANPLVCCGSSIKDEGLGTHTSETRPTGSPHTTTTHRPQSTKNPKLNLLPDRRYCGYQHFDDYFHSENLPLKSSLDEFPWLAALIYVRDGKPLGYGCAGSLISKRYVLTAGHCLMTRDTNLVTVRLGEHNIQKGKDCIKNEQFEECKDPVADFGVEEAIIHPQWNARTKENDIGLIRLNKSVTYTDFIRPICLPFPGIKLAKVGDYLFLSGWARGSFAGEVVEIKRKLSAQLTSLEECRKAYNHTKIVLTDNQNCIQATEHADVFSCQGDSGSPVMLSHRNQWHQEGTVSFRKACGIGRAPGVNTRVVNYLEWILDNIRK